MSIFDLGFTAAYRRLERTLTGQFRARKAAAIERIKARREAERRNAAINLLLDDAKFNGVNPTSLLGREHEEAGYKSAIAEDWGEDL
jgi:hypothetical protein